MVAPVRQFIHAIKWRKELVLEFALLLAIERRH